MILYGPDIRTQMDTFNNGSAVAAVTSPIWLPWLEAASQIAAIVAPILGVAWLAVQIWSKITLTIKERNDG